MSDKPLQARTPQDTADILAIADLLANPTEEVEE